jgi:hypothetical protein
MRAVKGAVFAARLIVALTGKYLRCCIANLHVIVHRFYSRYPTTGVNRVAISALFCQGRTF